MRPDHHKEINALDKPHYGMEYALLKYLIGVPASVKFTNQHYCRDIMMNHLSKFPRQMLFLFSGICALLVFAAPIKSFGATYYVATNGSDSAPGTLNAPFKSFAQGVGVLQPGDSLIIREGIWTEQIRLAPLKKTGTPGNYITIAGYPGETVIIRYADLIEKGNGPINARGNLGYLVFENLVLDGINSTNGTGWQIRDGNHHFILRNLEIRNFKYNGLYISASDVQVTNCKIHDQVSVSGLPGERWYGIYFHDGLNGLIEGNDIYNNPGGGIQAYPGEISNLIIRNNTLHHNNYLVTSAVEGIIVFQGGTTRVTGVQIYNNLIYLNGEKQPFPGKSGGIRVANGASSTKIWNNTIYGNKGWGINIQTGVSGPPGGTVVQNNIIFENTAGQIIDAGSDSTLTHNLTTDPKFIKVESFNFKLQELSPAIDAGITLSTVTTDIMNFPRPYGSAYDMGAYEVGTSSSNSPTAPQKLSIR